MRTLVFAVLAALSFRPTRAAAQPHDEHRDDYREERREKAQARKDERAAKPPRPAKAARPKPLAKPRRPAGVPAPAVRARPAPRAEPIRDARHILRDKRGAPAAPLDEHGHPVTVAPTTEAPNHALIENRTAVVRIIQVRERDEQERNRYYWHHEGGVRYCHYYDAWGAHWYGFYLGPRFYWTRRWVDRWWWYDPVGVRWVYWHDGYWWWQDPLAPGSLYVYMNGNYVPYGPLQSYAGGPAVTVPLTPAPPAQAPAPAQAQVYYSPDGTRVAQIVGDDHGAWLYDSSVSGTPAFLAELSTGAANIRFSSAPASQILVERLDGSFGLFDADGRPQ